MDVVFFLLCLLRASWALLRASGMEMWGRGMAPDQYLRDTVQFRYRNILDILLRVWLMLSRVKTPPI